MKAKEYAATFNTDPTLENLTDILVAFFQEALQLQEARKVGTAAGEYAILNEQDQKWRAFCRLVKGAKEEGFMEIVKEFAPEHYEDWMRYQRLREAKTPQAGAEVKE